MTTWCDASTAVQVVESGNNAFGGGMLVTPTPLIQALVARGEELEDVELVTALVIGAAPYTDPRWAGHCHGRTCFVGAFDGAAVNAGRGSCVAIYVSAI